VLNIILIGSALLRRTYFSGTVIEISIARRTVLSAEPITDRLGGGRPHRGALIE